MDKCTGDNYDLSLYSPKKQGQLRGEGLSTSVARTCQWSLARLDESWEYLQTFQGQHMGQPDVH